MRGRATSTYRINIKWRNLREKWSKIQHFIIDFIPSRRCSLPAAQSIACATASLNEFQPLRLAMYNMRSAARAAAASCHRAEFADVQNGCVVATTDFHGFVKIFRRRWDRMRSTKIESWICLPWCLAVKLLWDPKSLLLTGHFHCSEFKSIFGGECRLGRHPGSQDWAQTVLLGAGHVPNELWWWNNCFHGKRRFYIHLL